MSAPARLHQRIIWTNAILIAWCMGWAFAATWLGNWSILPIAEGVAFAWVALLAWPRKSVKP